MPKIYKYRIVVIHKTQRWDEDEKKWDTVVVGVEIKDLPNKVLRVPSPRR